MLRSKIISVLAIYLCSGQVVGQISAPNRPSIELLQNVPEVVDPVMSQPESRNENTDRRGSLLESPWKIGYGEATTGAGYDGNLYTVTNTNDDGPGSLRQGIETPNTWVVYSPTLDGSAIYIKSSLRPAANTTWDGRDALVRIAPHSSVNNITMLRYSEGNSIMHRVLVAPDNDLHQETDKEAKTAAVTAILISTGENYWIDHVEVYNTDDDALGLGNTASSNSAINITVTHYKVYSANKGLLISGDQSPAQNAGRTGRKTIAWSDFAAKCRNFRNSGAREVHGFNNYTHSFGGGTCGTAAGHGDASNRDGTQTPSILVESSVFNDDSVGLVGTLQGNSSIRGLPVQGYVFTDGQNMFEGGSSAGAGVIGPSDSNTSPVNRPVAKYAYPKMPATEVKAYVLENAGVNGRNIVFPVAQ